MQSRTTTERSPSLTQIEEEVRRMGPRRFGCAETLLIAQTESDAMVSTGVPVSTMTKTGNDSPGSMPRLALLAVCITSFPVPRPDQSPPVLRPGEFCLPARSIEGSDHWADPHGLETEHARRRVDPMCI